MGDGEFRQDDRLNDIHDLKHHYLCLVLTVYGFIHSSNTKLVEKYQLSVPKMESTTNLYKSYLIILTFEFSNDLRQKEYQNYRNS